MKPLSIPEKGQSEERILEKLEAFKSQDPDYRRGKTWSLVYYLSEAHESCIQKAYSMYAPANGLDPMTFKSLKTMETEIIRMTAGLLHGGEDTCGIVTSGGTESCLLAVKTYRDMARKKRHIKRPEMVIPETAHVAWEKGGEYFQITIRRAKTDSNGQVDPKSVEKLITKRTVMILGSAPEYPHGIIDPIEELGQIAQSRDIPLHVDACVGGFLLPFIEAEGEAIPPWDYRVPGVSSVSADIHKYGFSAKGASAITYRSPELMRYQFFVYENWPGGVFASPGLLGTRPGGIYAAAWAALHFLGQEGYRKNAREIIEIRREMISAIEAIPEFTVIGKPLAGICAFTSKSRDVNIYAAADVLEKRGWHIDRLQFPPAIQVMITPRHRHYLKQYLQDLKDAADEVRGRPELAKEGSAAAYGMMAGIPLRKRVKKEISSFFVRLYTSDAPADETLEER